ncbi:alpha/beta hydrolase [Williamsia maris]|uniref:Alpha/beta hydrolase n=1 Tax=Williamsia maris TaxID=72806 RepID=A0ABT1HJR2_9NOCA|nr:alpha/beta hydrolase [Williamsia maris]MCP2178178.1 Alpha/beta hydrolase [Williamsia maris]
MNVLTRDVEAVREWWRGDSARASATATASERQFGNRLGIAILDIADGLNRLGPAYARACETARDTAESIRALGYLVADDGVVRAPSVGAEVPRDADTTADAARLVSEHQRRLRSALDEVRVADADLAGHIGRALEALTLASLPATHPVAIRSEVRRILDHRATLPRDPFALNRFWGELTAMEKAGLWNADRSIGNRDGIPAADRDHFNRRHLVELQRDETRKVARYLRGHPYIVDGQIPRSPGPGGYVTETRRRRDFDAVTRTHRALDGIETALQDPTGAHARLLLHIDTRGRVAIAITDPDTARNVATFVPGTGSNAGNVRGGADRAAAMVTAAERADPTATTSVIAWYAYDAPAGLAAAAGPASAAHAAGPLDAFQAGLRATHDGPEPFHTTVIGHSYGTVVVGEAASQGHTLDADDLVFVGSPGIGDPDSPADRRLTDVDAEEMNDHVYATTAARDPIGITEGIHGMSPTDPDFGGRVFASDPGSSLSGSAHGEYWDIGPDGRMNRSLTAMGMIIAGRGDEVR